MTDFDTFTKIALPKSVGDLGKLLPRALKSCPKSNKSHILVTLVLTQKVASNLDDIVT